ncbi:hypothetical protein HpHNI66_14920 [Helicobacter pylori]
MQKQLKTLILMKLKNSLMKAQIVEQINRNKSEFIFKTMFKEKGDYKNAPGYEKNIKEND